MSTAVSHQMQEQIGSAGNSGVVDDIQNPTVRPFDFLEDVQGSVKDTVLVLLNQDWALFDKPDFFQKFQKLWHRSTYKVCVDGGLKILHHINESIQRSGNLFLPDLVSGDFDSANPKLLEFYRNQGTEIEHTPEQDNTDFTKCIAIIGRKLKAKEIENFESVKHVVALSGVSERFDHSLSNINTVFQTHSHEMLPSSCELYLLSEDTCTTVLRKGTTKVGFSQHRGGGWCSLLPVGKPSNVYTKGLRFDLSGNHLGTGKQMMKFNRTSEKNDGFHVSTQNSIVIAMEVIN